MTRSLVTVLTGITLFLTASCSKNARPEKPEEEAPVMSIALSAPVNQSMNDFSFSLFRTLLGQESSGNNIFISPLSLHMALGMVANGATGVTREEILQTLGADQLSMDALNESYLTLLEKLPIADPKVTLSLANSIWYKNTFSVENSFIRTMKDYFRAKVTPLPFSSSDVATINQWASDNTNGRIRKILESIDPLQRMFLVNALYFKGKWHLQFDKNNTRSEDFTRTDGSKISVKMMHLEETVKYAATDKLAAVQKAYGNGQFTITLLLPAKQTGDDPLAAMTKSDWSTLQAGFRSAKIEIGLPKFQLQQQYDLIPLLKTMGIKKAFEDNAEFSALTPEQVSITKAQQDVFAAVDEEGTEAAAVTNIGIGLTSAGPPARFICDRPFGIIISENTSNSILFMGRVAQPSLTP